MPDEVHTSAGETIGRPMPSHSSPSPRGSLPWRRAAAAALFLALPAGLEARAADAEAAGRGERIYRELCAPCHGASGEGVKDEFPRPLVGDKSRDRLASYIEKRMPKGEPDRCVGEDAKAVASHVYDAFYSSLAQARNRPPSIDPSRLTVRQFRNAVADLVGGSRARIAPGPERGLRARYFNSRAPRGRPALERVDPEVRFECGPSRPPPDGVDSTGFAARWEGSLLAAETGEHELVVRTNQAARLWVNDPDAPLIDAWVRSGNDTEYRGSVFLLAGRAYPLRLEFTSGHQGVEKEGEKKPLEAFLRLCWKAPNRAEEVIPTRRLSPDVASPTLALRAPFPPDDSSVGYERGTSVSGEWQEALTEAAMEAAGKVSIRLEELAGLRERQGDRRAAVADFCRGLVERAFRRPLSAEQQELYVDRQLAEAKDLETGVKRVVMLALQSPRFLYLHQAGSPPDPWTVASRLSFALWDSLPDADLLQAAASGRLASPEEAERQAERMARDPRGRAKLLEFLHGWLQVDRAGDLPKDPKRFPGFDDALASDLRTSLDFFLEDFVGSERADFRDLLLSSELYVNGRMARFYGFDLPADAPFRKVTSEAPRRFGILTHPYVMAMLAHPDSTSPIHRGVFVVRKLIGRTLRPPPQAFAPLSPDLHPDLTTRERVSLQTQPETCQGCHGIINPVGFTLEHLDAVGRWRDDQGGKPIDSSGSYDPPAGTPKSFCGDRDLAEYLASSEETRGAFVAQLFHYMIKQPILAYGPEMPVDLRKAFEARDLNVRELTVEIARKAALPGGAAVSGARPPAPAPAAKQEAPPARPDPDVHGDSKT